MTEKITFGLHATSIWMQDLIFDDFLAFKNFKFCVKAVKPLIITPCKVWSPNFHNVS